MTAAETDHRPTEPINRTRFVLQCIATILYFVLALFLPAGNWLWERGWLFLLVMTLLSILSVVYILRVNPEVLTARVNAHQGTKPWDRVLIGFLLPTIMAILPVAAFDDGRFHWLPLPWWVCALGYVLLLFGIVLVAWAQGVNRFFEVTVRIQQERGHHVIDTGPYAFVRHPGYVSFPFISAGIALSLGSVWALIPAGLSCLLVLLRTAWEDQTLQAELPGYREYAQRVRYRWIPGVW
jgi:protein-S-isoprenylcysteine O-methyltransferase Ste14